MKKVIALAVSLVISTVTMAQGHVGQCVYPKTVPTATGGLAFKERVYVYSKPDVKSDSFVLGVLEPMSIRAESKDGLVQLTSTSHPGMTIGWVKLKSFEFQDLRNCN